MAAYEILALNESTPQILAPGTGSTYSAPRALAIAPEALTGAAATTSLDITQTWNTSGTPTALKVNVTNTASNASSLLMDLQVSGVSKFKADINGNITIPYSGSAGRAFNYFSGNNGFRLNGAGITGLTIERGDASRVASFVGTSSVLCGSLYIGATIGGADGNCILERDADDTLALRRSTNAQTLRVYTTYTDASNHSRLVITGAAITLETAGTGADNIDLTLTPAGTGNVVLPGGVLLKTATALTNGAAASAGTMTNAPAAGNPTKWIPINDNGTTRYIPAW